MTVIWMILKALGIAVLVILGLFAAALLAVLFVPVRYRADGSWREELTASAKLTWLFRLVCVRITYEKRLSVQASVCGIRILKKKKQTKRSCGSGQGAEPEPPAGQGAGQKTPSAPEPAAAPGAAAAQEAMPENAPETGTDGRQKEPDAKKASKPGMEGNPEPSDGGKRRRFSPDTMKNRLAEAFRKLRDSLANTRSSTKRLYGQFVHYKAIWDREETRQAFRLASSQLRRTLRHVLPRRMDVRAAVGTGDPASTGQILAIHGMLYPWLGDRVQIVPDFEEKRFEGEFHLKGQIRAGTVGFYALRLMLDRNVRRLIGILRGRTSDKEDHNGRKQGQ